ncbi:MAG: Trm112 family protein [Terracidiphilus sp.]
MSSEPRNPSTFNKAAFDRWIDQLACPVCLGALRLEETRVVCIGCGRAYPVEDGIPVLIVERAVEPSL